MKELFFIGAKEKQPNQSLKPTEPAVDDFAAREFAENDMISKYVRATNYKQNAARRRSTSLRLVVNDPSGRRPVGSRRQLSSGPLGSRTNSIIKGENNGSGM